MQKDTSTKSSVTPRGYVSVLPFQFAALFAQQKLEELYP